jgi:hypothetical protein
VNDGAPDFETRRARLSAKVPAGYHPAIYFGAVNLLALAAIAGALSGLAAVTAWEWCVVPVAFFVANLCEHRVHRGPMHHLNPRWRILYERHTRQHHVFFDHHNMAVRDARDYYWVFFPWWAVGLVLIAALAFASPLLWWSGNAARLFFAVAVGYYLTYEWLHFSHHLPPESAIGRLPWLVALRRLHVAHHDPAKMAQRNFNITFPIGDAIFGTLDRGDPR